MTWLTQLRQSLLRREDGQDLTEYALLVALVALAAVGAVTAAGGRINDVFNGIVTLIPKP
jgi:Flp pilus assembly pilin Flp